MVAKAKVVKVAAPTKRELKAASKDLRGGDPAGSKVLLDQKAAIAQGVVKKPKPKS